MSASKAQRSPVHLLIVSYAFPRAGSGWGGEVGGERMRQFARLLPQHGIRVSILTHRGAAAGNADLQRWAALDLSRLAVEGMTALKAQRTSKPSAGTNPREGWTASRVRTAARRWVVPDRATYAWAPFAVAAGLRRAHTQPGAPQVVLSSSPPFAAHVVAYTLAKTWGIPWIADVRDGYSFEPPEGYSPLRAVRRRLEQTLYAHAARVFTVTEALSDDLRTLLPARRDRIETIENGFDAALFETPTPRPASSRDDWTVLYAGSVSFGAGRNLRALMTGVDRISTQSHQTVRLQLIGIFAPSDVAPGLQHARLQLCGWQARSEVARSMQAADVLVVLTGNHKTVATTKLYEYIGAGRPILVVGRQSAAARIVSEGQFGLVTDDDPNGIAAALTQLQRERAAWEAHLQSPPVCSARARFSRETQAAQLAAHVHALLATD